MKRFLSLILCFLLAAPMVLPLRAEEEVIPITSREELEAIQDAPEGHYRLDADIDLGAEVWAPIPFHGVLDGNDHVLYNLRITDPTVDNAVTVDGNNKEYETHFAALFSLTQNAEIRNLNLIGADLQIETGYHCFSAVLAGYMENTVIDNCYVEGRIHLATTNGMVGVGGVAGFGTGTIQNCRADVFLTFADRSDRTTDIRPEQFMGGLLACGNATLLDNSVTIRGFDSCYGFVHNGGLVGMHYQWDHQFPNGQICGNTVRGSITFFEKNPRRRAYCAPFGGELLTYPYKMQNNRHDFRRLELFNRSQELADHNCEDPDLMEINVPHKEKSWGYTLHQCRTCGFEWRSDYQAPGHIPGEWEIMNEATYESLGSRRQRCTVCGEVLSEESIPKRIAASVIILSSSRLSMHYKESVDLKSYVRPKDAENQEVHWFSSDPSVVSVDQQGRLTALKCGEADITCDSDDGFASSTCSVKVKYSFLQWLIVIFLFGWIWY